MADPILTPIYQEYTIDMSSNNNFVQVPSIQGDGNYVRYVRILLVVNNAQYIIPEGVGAYIVGTKPDNKNIFNSCEIDENGRIIVEITSEMTAVSGRGDYQIMLVDATTNSQLKSFPFYLITTKSFNAENITSSDEYQALTEALSKILADYTYIMTTCEEYKDTAVEASQNALASEEASSTSELNAKISEDNAKDSENAAKASELASKDSENAAKVSEDNAKASELAAAASAESSNNAEEICTEKANEANDYADLARKWAVWEEGEQIPGSNNNARYWANKAKEWSGFDDIDATSITYTKEDGSKVILADYLKFLEDLDGETILVL